MNQFTLIDGINLAIVGIVVVFLVLLLLMIAIELTAKVVNRKDKNNELGKIKVNEHTSQKMNGRHIAIITTVLNQELDLNDYQVKVVRKKEVEKND